MAQNDIEVEIKTPVSKKDFIRIRKFLKKSSNFIKSSRQIDHYYSPTYKSFLKPKYPYEWLSIRERGGKIVLNYKHWYPEGMRVTTHCDEYQTEIIDNGQLSKILSALKFEKLVTVGKERLIFEKDDLEIALDEVRGLGYFIEIESLKNSGGISKTREKILAFAKTLKLDTKITVPGGYAAELMRRKGLLH